MIIFIAGICFALLIVGVLFAILMPNFGRFFFVSDQSILSFEDTVQKIREACDKDEKWVIQSEKDFNMAYEKTDKGVLPHRLVEFKLGNPDHSYEVNLAAPEVCTFMPAAIAIVEYEANRVMIYRKNTGMMGLMFKEPMRSIMGTEVPEQLNKILDGIIK